MHLPYCYKYPRPAVTVDLVLFTLEQGALKVLLIRRKHDPFAGRWAIPGGFLEMDEPAEDAARRELREETGLNHRGPLDPIGAFSAPGRDPRGRTISLAFAGAVGGRVPWVAGGDDAAEAMWCDAHAPGPLAFDHADILAAGLDWLTRAVDEGAKGLAVLPREFDRDDVRGLFLALGRTPRAATTWRTRLARAGTIVAVPKKEGRFRAARR